MKSKKFLEFEPNKAYPLSGRWNGLYNRVSSHRGKPVWVKLALTPDLFSEVGWTPRGITEALEKGYLDIQAQSNGDGNIFLSVMIDENLGDEDGFGVEPDDYLVGVVARDGTFIEKLHVKPHIFRS